MTVSVLYRPVEQLLSRTIADHDARGVPAPGTCASRRTIQLALGVLFVVVALALRGARSRTTCSVARSALYWVLVVAVLAYAASYFARGFLAGHHRFELYGGLVFMEATARLMFALAVTVGIASGQTAVALGIAAAPAAVAGGGAAGAGPAGPLDGGRARHRPVRRRGRVHALQGGRVRRGGAGDHAGRADLPQRRARCWSRPPRPAPPARRWRASPSTCCSSPGPRCNSSRRSRPRSSPTSRACARAARTTPSAAACT